MLVFFFCWVLILFDKVVKSKNIKSVLVCSVPVGAAFSLFTTLFYNGNHALLYKINHLVSGRVYIMNTYYKDQGLSLFPRTQEIFYTSYHGLIDNSYMQVTFYAGILVAVLFFVIILKNHVKIVPDGVLFGSSKAHKSIRKEIVENQRLEAVISMPSGVFKPYAGVSTAILIFTKTEHGGTDHVWFYDMKADGFSLDDKRTPVAENDIPDIIERFENREKEVDRKRTEQSFMVPKKDIVENEYDLSINKYKEVEYIPVEYPPTSEIMENIRELENEIGKEMDELEKLLKM